MSGKLLASLAYFEGLASPAATHYVRVEDDVYLFADRLAFALRARDRDDRTVVARYSANETAFAGLRYPRGFAVVLPARVANGLAALDRAVGLAVDSAAASDYGKPAGAKGGWVRGTFWCDDQYLGLLLHPLDVDLASDARFHDLPSRGFPLRCVPRGGVLPSRPPESQAPRVAALARVPRRQRRPDGGRVRAHPLGRGARRRVERGRGVRSEPASVAARRGPPRHRGAGPASSR